MGKKSDDDELGKMVEELISDVADDRERLTKFWDSLLNEHADQPAGIAEYVAKLADASTRQAQVRVATIKALAKKVPTSDDDDDMADAIGLPFDKADELEDGSN